MVAQVLKPSFTYRLAEGSLTRYITTGPMIVLIIGPSLFLFDISEAQKIFEQISEPIIFLTSLLVSLATPFCSISSLFHNVIKIGAYGTRATTSDTPTFSSPTIRTTRAKLLSCSITKSTFTAASA